jgi:uncharacterized membrane protein YdjX (TVP38/TMEM64 family)
MTRSSAWRLVVLAVVAAGVLTAVVLLPVKDYLQQFLAWVQDLGFWGPVVLALVYVPAAVLCVPGSLLTLGAGFAFGLVAGTAAASAGATTGAAAAFLISRYLARGLVEEQLAGSPRFRALDRAVADHGLRIVLLTRLSPLIPYTLLNYTFGLTSVRFRTYVLASWVGMLPGALLYTYLGTFAGDLARLAAGDVAKGPWYYVLLGAGLAATAAVTVYITRLARQALVRAVPEATAGGRAEDGANNSC